MKKRLGDLLLENKIITEEQLKTALQEQKVTNERLGSIFKRLGFVKEKTLIDLLSFQLKIPIIDFNKTPPSKKLTQHIKKEFAEENKVVPINCENNILTIALADPLNIFVIDEIQNDTNMEIKVGVASESEIMEWVNRLYYGRGSSASLLRNIEKGSELFDLDDKSVTADDSPVVRLVNNIITQAVRSNASDIHFDVEKNNLRIRMRVDGLLTDLSSPPDNLKNLIISRVKIISDLDIAEKRRPQDGRISLDVDGKEIDIRVSIIPTIYGERAVLRILDKSSLLRGLNEIGMADNTMIDYRSIINKPQGVILVTGPTGSGKTSTLYASLAEINTIEKNIITIEDPVEYELEHINQIQINPKAGLTFATGLRSILRQDPDVIMVGEIRDKETAKIAVQSALTGHLVFTTLHTLDAASSYTRLINMGVEPYLIASAVNCVLAQRLVRKICDKCKQPAEKTKKFYTNLKNVNLNIENINFFEGAGCEYCNNTGYKGRIGLFEKIITDDKIRNLIVEKANSQIIKQAAVEHGSVTLRQDGLRILKQGVTTLSEILRVTDEE